MNAARWLGPGVEARTSEGLSRAAGSPSHAAVRVDPHAYERTSPSARSTHYVTEVLDQRSGRTQGPRRACDHRWVFAAYRRVLSRRGAVRFSVASQLAQFPTAVMTIAVVLLVQDRTGSYTYGGTLVGALMIGTAIGAVPQGRLVDRHGQGLVLALFNSVWGAAFLGLVVSVVHDGPPAVAVVLAGLTGATTPSVGPAVLARWAHVVDGPDEVHTAYSLESAADDLTIMVAPVLVTWLAASMDPLASVGVALGAGLLGTYLFCIQRGTEPPAHPPAPRTKTVAPMPWSFVAFLTLLAGSLCTAFAGMDVVVVGFAIEQGKQWAAGPVLALVSITSIVGGLVYGSIAWSVSPVVRMRYAAIWLTVTLAVATTVSSVTLLALLLPLVGFAIGPVIAASKTIAEQRLPAARFNEGMTFRQIGVYSGFAIGAALAGALLDHVGPGDAFLLPAAAAGSALVVLVAA
jgi:MFS family permease